MSGNKRFSIELAQERRACQELLGRIGATTAAIQGLRERVQTTLGSMPSGVRTSFPQEISAVGIWQGKSVTTPRQEMTSIQLQDVLASAQALEREGQECLCQLIEIKEVRREARARELIGTLEVLRGEATGAKALLQRWHPGVLDEIDRDLKHLAAMIEAGDFIEARERLTRLRSTLQERQGTAMKLEEQDQQRWYVAEALRTVCSEMGWGEEQTPRLEDDQKPGSDILYEVDTYSAGTMAFRLSLEGLTADSPLSRQDRACYKDFGTVAEKLKILGVIAKLEAGESADDLPELRQRGEMDIPDEGVSQGMEA